MPAKKSEKKQDNISYNVPLRKSFQKVPPYKRAKKAVAALRAFLLKHLKADDVKIGKYLNEFIWVHGIKNPPHHVKVHAFKEEGTAYVELEGKKYEKPKEKELPEEGGLKGKIQNLTGASKSSPKSARLAKKGDSKSEDEAKDSGDNNSDNSLGKSSVEKSSVEKSSVENKDVRSSQKEKEGDVSAKDVSASDSEKDVEKQKDKKSVAIDNKENISDEENPRKAKSDEDNQDNNSDKENTNTSDDSSDVVHSSEKKEDAESDIKEETNDKEKGN